MLIIYPKIFRFFVDKFEKIQKKKFKKKLGLLGKMTSWKKSAKKNCTNIFTE